MDKSVRRVDARETGAATAVSGYANSGVHFGDVNLLTGAPVVTRYHYVVEAIKPVELVGREAELQELKEFCVSPESAGAYSWWRAPAWAGKSALMSWFVLNPPPAVRLVSFFVTARFSSQNDRSAFLENVLEQLLAILGQQPPSALTEATRQSHVLGLLAEAAAACRDRGESFVLLVDGLDEDRSVHTGADAHSIAALLPEKPPHGMRIIVTGRPNPPVPADVPAHHPLRDPAAIRELAPSPRAGVIRGEMERELKRLLQSDELDQHILGLLTTAGGGLSVADFAELTGAPEWEVKDRLRTVSGRTYSVRHVGAFPVFLLGHEELQVTAQEMLGTRRRHEYLAQLNAWADRQQAQRWPPGSPEYLLSGYFALLQRLADVDRMVRFATDLWRRERLRQNGNSDTVSEVLAAEEACASRSPLDLLALGRLAVHRCLVRDQGENIPRNLPMVWAQLGQADRAEALARAITDPLRRVEALSSIVSVLVARGSGERAKAVASEAVECVRVEAPQPARIRAMLVAARGLAEAGERAGALELISSARREISTLRNPTHKSAAESDLVAALTDVGDLHSAERAAKRIDKWSEKNRALVVVATHLAAQGLIRRALTIASHIHTRVDRADALTGVAVGAHEKGNPRTARKVLQDAEDIAGEVANTAMRPRIHAQIAQAWVKVGERPAGVKLLVKAVADTHKISKASDRDQTCILVAKAAATVGEAELADAAVQQVKRGPRRAKALAAAALGFALAGMGDRAEALAQESESVAIGFGGPEQLDRGLVAVASALVRADDLDKARIVIPSISNRSRRRDLRVQLAEAHVRRGEVSRALEVLARLSSESQLKALVRVVKRAVAAGHASQAQELVTSVSDPEVREELLKVSATQSNHRRFSQDPATRRGSTGDVDAAMAIEDPFKQYQALTRVARHLVSTQDIDGALRIADLMSSVHLRIKFAAALGRFAQDCGDPRGSRQFLVRGFDEIKEQGAAFRPTPETLALVQASAECGHHKLAEDICDVIQDDHWRGKFRLAFSAELARAGELDWARRVVRLVPDSPDKVAVVATFVTHQLRTGDLAGAETAARAVADPQHKSEALAEVADNLMRSEHADRAEECAMSIPVPAVQVRALAGLATGATGSRARRLLGLALRAGPWEECADALVRVEPGLVDAVVEECSRVRDFDVAEIDELESDVRRQRLRTAAWWRPGETSR